MGNFVFQSFKMNLGMQKVDWDSDINVWLVPKKINDQTKIQNQSCSSPTFEFFEDKVDWLKIGTIHGFNIDSVNKVTNVVSDNTYEAMEQYPASAYIFSNDCPAECWVPKDYEYMVLADTHYKVSDLKNLDAAFNTSYWDNNYAFSGKYDSSEFQYYNIPEHILNEDMVRISAFNTSILAATDFSGYSGFSIEQYKGEGCVISYSETRYNNKKEEYKCYHPICYVEFAKPHGSAEGRLKIDWASNGCIQAE